MLTTVSTTAQLEAALNAAHGGDTIQLTHGTYDNVLLRELHFASGVTITSASSASPAVITGLTVTSSSGLTFSQLTFYADPHGADLPFRVTASQDIGLDHLNVHGSLDGNPKNDHAGFLIRDSSNVTVTNSEFQQLAYAVSHLSDDHLTISGNSFHDIRMDGVRGGGSSWVTVSNNAFRSFYPNPKDHPDAVQFWTRGTTASAHDITVTDNTVVRGDGGPIQGVFMRDEVGGLPFKNVTVVDNLVVGGLYNGVSVNGAQNATIQDNLVEGFSDHKSYMRVSHVHDGVVTGNSANHFIFESLSKVSMANNAILQPATDGGAATLAIWSSLHANGNVQSAPVVESQTSVALKASAANLVLTGSALTGNGNSLDNHITGNAASNLLDGKSGHDVVVGAGGADTLFGGTGNDTLRGGAGADVFVFAKGGGHDMIADFGNGGHDVIDASSLLAAGAHATVVQAGADVEIDFSTGESLALHHALASHLHATSTGWVF